MRISTILTIALIALGMNCTTPVADPNVDIRQESYEVLLDGLCPNAPSEDAVECKHSMNLAQGFEHVLATGNDTLHHGQQSLDFVTCFANKVPSFNLSLSMFCFYKGQKEEYIQSFHELSTKEEFAAMKLALLEKMSSLEGNPVFYEYFEKLLLYHQEAENQFKAGTLTATSMDNFDSGMQTDSQGNVLSADMNDVQKLPLQ